MCHRYRIADREPLWEYEEEPEDEPADEFPGTEPTREEEKPEQPLPTADD